MSTSRFNQRTIFAEPTVAVPVQPCRNVTAPVAFAETMGTAGSSETPSSGGSDDWWHRAALFGTAPFLLLEARPTDAVRREMHETNQDLNERNRNKLGLWGAGVAARQRLLRRVAARFLRLYVVGLPIIAVVGVGLMLADLASP